MLTTQNRQAGRPFECDRVRLLMAKAHHACMLNHSENTGPLGFTHSKKAVDIPIGRRMNCARYARTRSTRTGSSRASGRSCWEGGGSKHSNERVGSDGIRIQMDTCSRQLSHVIHAVNLEHCRALTLSKIFCEKVLPERIIGMRRK